MLEVIVIRSAKSHLSAKRTRLSGKAKNSPLVTEGKTQANCLGYNFASNRQQFDRVYASTAWRSKETAQIVAMRLDIPFRAIIKSSALLERDFGEWEGQKVQTLRAKLNGTGLLNYLTSKAPPGGESLSQVYNRTLDWFDALAHQEYARDRFSRALIVTHSTPIRLFHSYVSSANPANYHQFKIDFTGVCAYRFDGKKWSVSNFNDTSHLHKQN